MSHPSQEAPSQLRIRVNGETHALPAAASVSDLVAALGLVGRKLAVAVNREVVPRARYAQHRLRDGDRVEILEAVGGG